MANGMGFIYIEFIVDKYGLVDLMIAVVDKIVVVIADILNGHCFIYWTLAPISPLYLCKSLLRIDELILG